MLALRQILSFAFRRFFKSPGFVLAVVVSIGLGIAANSTIFSMVTRFVFAAPPVENPKALLAIHTTYDGDQCCNSFSWPVYSDIREQAKSFSGVAAYYDLLPASIGGSGEPERVWGQATTANYFDVAQLPLPLGRGFAANEENAQVIVLSHRLWRRRFSSDRKIVGKAVSLSGRPFTIIGVAPPGFRGLDIVLDPEFWVPLDNVATLTANVPPRTARDWHWISVVARLKPTVTQQDAVSELSVLANRMAQSYPATDKGTGFVLNQAGSMQPGRDHSTLLLFLAALSIVVVLVLGIACANVTNLVLAQSATRQREMAVRIALGATRGQLIMQMLVESVLLALAGGIVGTILSLWATYALSTFHVPAPVPLDMSVTVDWRVLIYTFSLSFGAGLLFGIVPAWIASRPVLATALKGEDALARPGRRVTLRDVLVVSQIAMSLVLLCATGLFLRSLEHATTIDIGFRNNGILMMSVDPRLHGYTPEATTRFITQLRDRVAGIPGVVSIAGTDAPPLNGGNRSDGFVVEGRPAPAGVPSTVDLYMATPGYFETLGIARVAGRDFANESPTGPKVAIVNQLFVDRFFGHENPIGQHVNGGGVPYEIVGVVQNIKSRTLGEELRPVLFRSLAQTTGTDPSGLGYTLLIRSDRDTSSIADAARREIHSLDPSMAIYNVETMEAHVRSALFLPRLAGTLFGIFGMTGLILATVGLYGVMSYSVSRRTREIGIRLALGAQLGAVERLVIRQGMVLTAIAVAIGLPAALAASKFANNFLYGIRPHDTITFTTLPLFLAAVALIACWIPARRAAKIDPQRALRYE